MKKAIFPGSFNPFHAGHQSIVKKALKIFDEIIIVLAINPKKNNNLENNKNEIEKWIKENKLEKTVSVLINNSELTADFAKQHNVNHLIRSVRHVKDFKLEIQLQSIAKKNNPSLETVLFFSDGDKVKISSSMLREEKTYKNKKA